MPAGTAIQLLFWHRNCGITTAYNRMGDATSHLYSGDLVSTTRVADGPGPGQITGFGFGRRYFAGILTLHLSLSLYGKGPQCDLTNLLVS